MISHVFLNLDGKSKVIIDNTGKVQEDFSDFKGLLAIRGWQGGPLSIDHGPWPFL
jgi:hypothetical protein